MHLRTRTKLLLATVATAAIGVPLLVVAPTTAGAATAAACATTPTSLHVALTAPVRVIYPQRATISVAVTQDDASPACGVSVSIVGASGAGPGKVQYSTTTGATGAFSIALWLGTNLTYTANATFTGLTPAVSNSERVIMYPRIGITSIKPTTVKRGSSIGVIGYVQPTGLRDVVPQLQVFDRTGTWRSVQKAYSFSPTTGVWSLIWTIPSTRHVGVTQVRAIWPQTSLHAIGASSARSITVV